MAGPYSDDESKKLFADALAARGFKLPADQAPPPVVPSPPAPPPQDVQSYQQALPSPGAPLVAAPAMSRPTAPRAPVDPSLVDAANANTLAAMQKMTPEERQAAMNAAAAGVGQSVSNVRGPAPAPQPPPPPPVDPSKVVVDSGPPAGVASPQAAPPPAPRPTVTPEHWVNTMDPQSRARLAEGQGLQLGAVDKEAASNAAAADEMADIAQKGNDDLRVQQLLDRQEADKQRQAIETHMAELQKRADAIGSEQLDPQRLYKSRGAVGNMFVALAAGLSSLGGPQSARLAMDKIQHDQDQDLQAQLHDIENSKEGLKASTGLLADKWRLFDNKDKAMAAARQEMLAGTMAQIDAVARKYQSPVIKANAEAMKGQLLQKFAAEGAQINKYVPAAVAGGGATSAQVAEYEKDLVKSGRMTPNEAHAEALRWGARQFSENPSTFYEKPGTGKDKGISPDQIPQHVTSTAVLGGLLTNPMAHIKQTDTAALRRDQDRYNALVTAYSHTVGIRNPEAGQHIYDSYIIKSDDPQKIVDEKLAAFRALAAKQPVPTASDAQASSDPAGFTEAGEEPPPARQAPARPVLAQPAPASSARPMNSVDTSPANDARFGELGMLKRPDGDVSTEISITVTDPRLNGGRPTNIPTLVKGQVNVPHLLAGGAPTREQQEMAIRRAAERQKAGAYLPSFGSIKDAVDAAEGRSATKGQMIDRGEDVLGSRQIQ